ncbi:uncharacterized protein MELLADRAFT_67782 [Melampsora larici-populina 98AG31]|uniref:Uncharacterized protein n=1 Tax=Melampsora larici-populina (strain 98AG31 / pathotype 3-4-7) TaxID=747676 RepID=F4S4E0_MELLP|nr:uncharacterized protein MELLADRAFT_67782 [Melampsora larici-populina 98AG31]EGG00487.1 hypothetical protein MELLADRAFT_67782 [Melampsora larici-populina 98AG31]
MDKHGSLTVPKCVKEFSVREKLDEILHRQGDHADHEGRNPILLRPRKKKSSNTVVVMEGNEEESAQLDETDLEETISSVLGSELVEGQEAVNSVLEAVQGIFAEVDVAGVMEKAFEFLGELISS